MQPRRPIRGRQRSKDKAEENMKVGVLSGNTASRLLGKADGVVYQFSVYRSIFQCHKLKKNLNHQILRQNTHLKKKMLCYLFLVSSDFFKSTEQCEILTAE